MTYYATQDFRIAGRMTFAGESVDPALLPQGDAEPFVVTSWLTRIAPATWLAEKARAKRAAHEVAERARVKAVAASKRALAMSKLAEAEKLETEARALEVEANRLDPPPSASSAPSSAPSSRPAQAVELNRTRK